MAKITTHTEHGIHFIEVNGEIDAGSSIYLDDALKSAGTHDHKKVIVDLSGLEYISSAGLGVFISHIEAFKSQEIRLALFGINETVKQVFEILGLEKLLNIRVTKEEAIATIDE